MKRISFYHQSNTMDCFPVALMNACAWKRVKIPNRKKLIKAARCEHGATISYEKAIALCPLDFKETTNEEVLKKGEGILTIMHPEYSMHACFCLTLPFGLVLVNSLLLKKHNKVYYEAEAIPFPKHKHQNRGWIIMEK